MKLLIKIIVVLVVVAGALLAGVVMYAGKLVKTGVETAGPMVLQVPVTLESARVYVLKGEVNLKNLHIGNPEGYKTPGLFDLGGVEVKLDTDSLKTDKIIIEKIHILEPVITYERGLTDSNISALLAKLQAKEEKEKEPATEKTEEPTPTGQKKKVVIKEFILDGAKVNVSLTALGGKSLSIPLPPIKLQNIGDDEGGASVSEVVQKILGAISGALVTALASSGEILGDGVDLLKDGAGEALKVGGDVLEGSGDLLKGAADLFKK